MTYRPKKLPWPEDQYVILKEHNECWIIGGWSRAMFLHHHKPDYGYTVLLASKEFIDRLRKDPSVREETAWAKEQRDKLDTTESSD